MIKTEDNFFQEILSEFSTSFGTPSSEHPNVYCLSKNSLIKSLNQIRDQIPSAKRIPGKDILAYLIKSGLAHPISIENTKPEQYIQIGLENTTDDINPVELLQAISPKGVICYFTAIQFHDLSTQIPTYHHIANINKPANKTEHNPAFRVPVSTTQKTKTKVSDRLGTKMFKYQDIPYYTTSRSSRFIPGIQHRHFTDKTIIAITTYEQTLLDTILKPINCGGESVVFEAWERSLSNLKESRLLSYLESINDNKTSRRVGYILTVFFKHKAGKPLNAHFQHAKKHLGAKKLAPAIPLLTGINYTQYDSDWHLEVP